MEKMRRYLPLRKCVLVVWNRAINLGGGGWAGDTAAGVGDVLPLVAIFQ